VSYKNKEVSLLTRAKMYLGRRLMRNVNPAAFSHYTKIAFKPSHLNSCKNLPDRDTLINLLPKNAVVAEIGVNRGEFSSKILAQCKPTKLHLVDMWSTDRYHVGIRKEVERKFGQEIEKGKIEINLGMSTEVIPTFPDSYFDWVYLDTDHLYENTKRELDLLVPKMKAGGIIAGHDYIQGNWDGVVRYGVIEAVRECCLKHDFALIYLTHELDIHPSFAIRKIH